MSKKEEAEQLKKIEEEAYFELCQIIAEAMQIQDVYLLDERIAYWKNKYKKLLDGAASPTFKKRIQFLLTQYYSSVTQYILSQIKFKETKKIENQGKALRELYVIIRDTNDLSLLEKKVKEWKKKYPVQSFLNMYQKRIASYTRQKNLEENAFEQDKAFSDLVAVTKRTFTYNELKQELENWEKEYSINNKYSIDDFIKHQSEVKRYVSDDYLISIAKDLNTDTGKTVLENPKISQVSASTQHSSLGYQAQAYSSLLSIAKNPNNIDDVFKWVYKNKSIKFDDKYSQLILNATYLNYSPKYLSSLLIPDIDISNPSLSFETYKNINDVKRYAIISYFNLLLPPEESISNDSFYKHIETIYKKVNQKHDISPIVNTKIEPIKSQKIQDKVLPKKEEVSPEMPHSDVEVINEISEDNPISYDSIVAISPLFLDIINTYREQATLVNEIDKTTNKCISLKRPTPDNNKYRAVN